LLFVRGLERYGQFVTTRTSGSVWVPLRSLMMGMPTDTKLDQLQHE